MQETILIVDDRPVNRQFLVTLLGYAGYDVIEASDGNEALEIARQRRPALIITDILMPTMDGYEFVKRLRADVVLTHVPVIFYSATYHVREMKALAKAAGVVAVLLKPSEPEAVLGVVRSALRGQAEHGRPDEDSPLETLAEDLLEKTKQAELSALRLRDVVEAGIELSSERDPGRVAELVCRAAQDILAAKYAGVAVRSGETTGVDFFGARFDPDTLSRLRDASMQDGVFERLWTEGRVIRWWKQEAALASDLPSDHPPVQSLLGAPMLSSRRAWGWLYVADKVGGEAFSAEEERIASLLAAQAAAACENAHLYEELRKNEERTSLALEAAKTGIWELNLATREVTWSDTIAPIFGLPQGSTVSNEETFFQFVHPDDRQSVRDAVERAVRQQRDYDMEFRAISPDGSIRWLAGGARVICGNDGQPLRLLGVSMDITERKQLEAQYQQAQKMEGIGRLAAGVAHDFNNLLTAILGNLDFLDERFEEGHSARLEVREARNAAQRAAGLTRQLLAFSRKQVLRSAVLDLNQLVGDMSQMLRRLIGEDIELILKPAPRLARIKADPTQIEQILVNLAVNAKDAMPNGGKLIIQLEDVELDSAYERRHGAQVPPGRYALFAVSDTGIGMAATTQSRIFEPFFTTKPPGQGTGLGLATVYGIVKQSGGYVWVYSEPGRGTTFKIYLPLIETEDATTGDSLAGQAAAPSGSETVLLVEDEQSVRLLVKLVLERAGYSVIEAEAPSQALAMNPEQLGPVDLLVTDVIMPTLNGAELYRRLLERQPRLKVLYMSGYTDDAIVQHGVLMPGIPFLEKPFTAEGLLRKVREVLEAPRA